MDMYGTLRTAAADRHRERLFGKEAVIELYSTAPETGETLVTSFDEGWFGQRVVALTGTNSRAAASGDWQFQIAAEDDWETSQAFMFKVSIVQIDGRRWRVKKVEKPIGLSLIWKLKAEAQ